MSTLEPRTVRLRDGREAVIRCAVEADAAALLENARETARGPHLVTAPDEHAFTVEEEEAWIRDHRDRPGYLAVVAEVDGQVAGLLNFRNGVRRRIAHRGTFGMSVLAGCRRLGIGDALLTTLLDWARASSLVTKVCLAVLEANAPARALYDKHGFVVEGRRPREIRFDDGTYADDLLMYRFVDR